MSTLALLFVAHLLLIPYVLDMDVDPPVGVRFGEGLGVTPKPLQRRDRGRSRGCRGPSDYSRVTLTQKGQVFQNVSAGKGGCAVWQAIFGEVSRKENVAVAHRVHGGDPALSVGGHGAGLHAR